MVGQLERKITMLHTVHLYVSLQITRLDFAANYPLSSNKIFLSHILRNMWPYILHESFEPCPNKGQGDWRSLAQFHPVNIQRKYAEMVWTCFKHSQHIPQTKSRWSQSSMPSNLQCHGLWCLCEEHKRTHISMTDTARFLLCMPRPWRGHQWSWTVTAVLIVQRLHEAKKPGGQTHAVPDASTNSCQACREVRLPQLQSSHLSPQPMPRST